MNQSISCRCERCKKVKECRYYGSSPDIEKNKVQNGEWLCIECIPKREEELDEAIEKLREFLEKKPKS